MSETESSLIFQHSSECAMMALYDFTRDVMKDCVADGKYIDITKNY